MPTTKTLQWPGSSDAIRLIADRWEGSQTVFIESPENFGAARQANITFYSENSNRGATVAVAQAAYTVSASLSSLTFDPAETTAKQIEIVTNGSELKDVVVTFTGANADKFTYTGPTLQSSTATESRYIIEVKPVGVNSGNEDLLATLNVKAGSVSPVQVSVTQYANAVVSVNYSNFQISTAAPGAGGYSVSVPTNTTGSLIRASGDTFDLKLDVVYCTRTETLSDGTKKVDENYLYTNAEWECKGTLGVPTRVSFAEQTTSGVLSIVCPDLENNGYIQEKKDTLYIRVRPAGTSYDFGPEQTITGGLMIDSKADQSWEIEDNIRTYEEASAIRVYVSGLSETDTVEVSSDLTLPAASKSSVALLLTSTAKEKWTSGYEAPDIPIEVVGQNTDSGIPFNNWLTGNRLWPYISSTLGLCTRMPLTFTTNTGAQRKVECSWKTADVGGTQALRMTMKEPQTNE